MCDPAPVTFGAVLSSSLVLGRWKKELVAALQLHIVAKQSGQGSVGRIWEAWCTFLQHMGWLIITIKNKVSELSDCIIKYHRA